MSIPLTVGGVTFQYPVQFDKKWAAAATGWAVAVTNALAPFSGGNGSLLTLTSQTTLPATAGFLRLAKTDTIDWRNNANSANLPLGINSSNQLTFNGSPIGASTALTDGHIFVGNISNQPADVAMTGDVTITDTGVTAIGAGKVVDSNVSATAAIAFSKLASTSPYYWYVANSSGVLTPIGVTASKAVITDSNGLPSASSVTSTELSYVHGVTSAIQTQIGTLLPLSGGTLSGPINMASNKITSLTAGSAAGDAVAFQQIKTFQTLYQPNINNLFSTTSTSFVATGNTLSITPSDVAHRIKIIAFGTLEVDSSSPGEAFITLYRNGIELSSLTTGFSEIASSQTNGLRVPTTIVHVDSPASTSAVNYEIYIRSGTGIAIGYGRGVSSLLLEEIV